MSTDEQYFDHIFETRTDDGFVNLSEIHRLVAPTDQRDTLKLLAPKKLKDACATLTTSKFNPVRSATDGTIYAFWSLALEFALYRKPNLKELARKWRLMIDNPMSELIKTEETLQARIDHVFGKDGIRYIQLDGKFFFAAPDLARLVLWDDKSQTPTAQNTVHAIKTHSAADDVLLTLLQKVYSFG